MQSDAEDETAGDLRCSNTAGQQKRHRCREERPVFIVRPKGGGGIRERGKEERDQGAKGGEGERAR